MRIRKIEIEEFGKLQDFCLLPGEGLTLIEGENESGKSTLLAFLRFALYGFPSKRSREGEEREKRLSWRSARACGCLTLEWQGREYRIFRKCVGHGGAREGSTEELSVIRLPEGEAVELGDKTPGEYFLGLPAELYDGSLCLTQSDAARVSAPGMGDAVGDLLFTGDAVFSAEAAEKKLQDARRELQHLKGGGGRIAELEEELARLDGAMLRAAEQAASLSRLREEQAEYQARIEAHRRELSEVMTAFACADMDRTLALFEDRRAALGREAACREALERIAAGAAAELPDKDFPVRAEQALREAEGAQERIAALAPVKERLSCVKYDEALLRGAALLETVKDADALPLRTARHAARRKRRWIACVVFFLMSVVAFAAGRLLPVWQRYAFASGTATALLCFILLCGALRSGGHVRRSLRAVGAPNASMLRTYIEQCKREGQAHRVNGEQLAAVEAELAEANAMREDALCRLRAELAAMGWEDVALTREGVTGLLAALARRKSEWQMALSEGTVAYERAKSAVEALSAQLVGQDEEALRTRREAMPTVSVVWESTEALSHRRMLLEQMIGALEHKRGELVRSEAALAAVAQDTEGLARLREDTARELAAAKTRLAALHLALEALRQAGEELRGTLVPRLRAAAAARFHELTGGVHGELHLGADLSVSVVGEGIPRPISHYSAGCRDAAHLALRIALVEGVCNGLPPLLFDEAFARLDDARAGGLLRMIVAYCQQGGQAILLTCHGREARFLAEMGGATYVKMPK